MYTPSSFFPLLLPPHYLAPSFTSLSLFFFLLFCLKMDNDICCLYFGLFQMRCVTKVSAVALGHREWKCISRVDRDFQRVCSPMFMTPKYTRRGSPHWLCILPACVDSVFSVFMYTRQLPHKSIKTEKWGMILNEHGYKVQRGGGCVYDVGCVCVTRVYVWLYM